MVFGENPCSTPSACSALLFPPCFALHQLRCAIFPWDSRWLTESGAPPLLAAACIFPCCLQAPPAAQHETAPSVVAKGSDPARRPHGWFAAPILDPTT